MITLKSIQNEFAKKAGFTSYKNLIEKFRSSSKVAYMTVIEVTQKSSIKFAEEAIAEQRELCAENAKMTCRIYKNDHGFYEEDYDLDKDSILNALSPTLK